MAEKETVNLDALIRRDDFQSLADGKPIASSPTWREVGINTLTPDDRLTVLRKPDFQRETSDWEPNTVSTFIKSVVDGDVVPAVILWRSSKTGHTFVIDGAHRLSALAAWVNDDFGDGDVSKRFYGNMITQRQLDTAIRTRELVESEVGNYAEFQRYNKNPSEAPTSHAQFKATSIFQTLSVQQIEGDAEAAEQSYIRINSTAAPISKPELTLINSRHMPDGIATRALMRAGAGYEYWGQFEEPVRTKIKELAERVYSQLIKPINDYPILALDLPAPRRGYSASSMQTILDLVTILNAPISGPKKRDKAADPDGTKTLAYLERVRRSTERVYGNNHSGSLALHPALYCYDNRGKFVGKAFIGAIEFVRYLIERNKVYSFTEHRKAFEDFLIEHPQLMNQIGSTQGSGGRRGVPAVVSLYRYLFDGLSAGDTKSDIIESIKASRELGFLEWHTPQEIDTGRRFGAFAEANALIRGALAKDICPECGGRFYIKDRSRDHKTRIADGGKSVPSNLELKHPFCNTGYKEARFAKSVRT